jgi:hypothetical protein
MKTNNKFLIAILIAIANLLTMGHLMAQTTISNMKDATPEQRAQFQTTMMKSKLSLDSGQITKIQAINLKYAQKFQPILKSSDGKLSKFRQVKALQKQKDAELQTVFTKDQYKKYQDFEEEMKSKMKERFNNN